MPAIAYLECSRCHAHVSAESPQTVCPQCGAALYVRYNMDELRRSGVPWLTKPLDAAVLRTKIAELLAPVRDPAPIG